MLLATAVGVSHINWMSWAKPLSAELQDLLTALETSCEGRPGSGALFSNANAAMSLLDSMPKGTSSSPRAKQCPKSSISSEMPIGSAPAPTAPQTRPTARKRKREWMAEDPFDSATGPRSSPGSALTYRRITYILAPVLDSGGSAVAYAPRRSGRKRPWIAKYV